MKDILVEKIKFLRIYLYIFVYVYIKIKEIKEKYIFVKKMLLIIYF